MLNRIKMDQRKEIYKYSQMVSVKFGKKWVIIKESQKVFAIDTKHLFHPQSTTKSSKSFFGMEDHKDHNHDSYMKTISFTLPSTASEVLDVHFIQSGNNEYKKKPANGQVFEESDDLIQILAKDFKNNVLVVATWDVRLDQEVSMH